MKKGLYKLILLVVSAVSLTGCKKEAKASDINEKKWYEEAIIYNVMVRSFYDSDGDGIGDYDGIVEKIDYFKELGVNTLWLISVMDSNTSKGVDVINYSAVESDFGTESEFRNMIEQCHKNDIRVIMDLNIAYTSENNPWFIDAVGNPNSQCVDFFKTYEEDTEEITDLYKKSNANFYYKAHYGATCPELDFGVQRLRHEIKIASDFWLDLGVDGFVAYKAHRIDSDNERVTFDWWQDYSTYLKENREDFYLAGRVSYYTTDSIAMFYESFDSIVDSPFRENIDAVIEGNYINYIQEMSENISEYKYRADLSGDKNGYRNMITSYSDFEHDRISSIFETDIKKKLAAAIMMTAPGNPCIYYGDEIGQYGTIGNNEKGVIEPMDWNRTVDSISGLVDAEVALGSEEKFNQSFDGISVEEEELDENSILNYYKKLISIRKQNPVFFNGEYEVIGKRGKVYVYLVKGADDGSEICVIHNFGEIQAEYELSADASELIGNERLKANDFLKIGAYETKILQFTAGERVIDYDEFSLNNSESNVALKIVVTLPEGTSEKENIYLTSNVNNWTTDSDKYMLTRKDDNTAEITIYQPQGRKIEYKFTKGAWENRERSAANDDNLETNNEFGNRIYSFGSTSETIYVTVDHWLDDEKKE